MYKPEGVKMNNVHLIKNIKNKVIKRLENIGDSEFEDEYVKNIIDDEILNSPECSKVEIKEKIEIASNLFNSLRRYGEIQPLIEDPEITEIMVNSMDKIFIEKHGKITKTDIKISDPQKLENIIQSMVSKANRAVNEAHPIVDSRLPDGSRINVVLGNISVGGTVLTIRKFSKQFFSIEKLINNGSVSQEAACLLDNLVRAKYNIFISGGTGSGKTTFLNALAGFIPEHERIITIEDSAELQIKHDNLVRLESRNANFEGKGAVTIRDLIRTALRMRPDRIIIGEVRGEEAFDMLQAMNTGHEGSMSTGHGNSCRDMLKRLEMMVMMGVDMPVEAIRQQIACAIDIVIHLVRMRDGRRIVSEICEVEDVKNGNIIVNPLFKLEQKKEDSKTTFYLAKTDNKFVNDEKLKF